MKDELAEEFVRRLMDLRGKPCWSFYAGPSTGSHVDFDFGRKVPRVVPMLGNRNLTDDQKFHEGEMSLFIECAWRLDSDEEVICGSTDSNEKGGPMLIGLQSVLNRVVEDVDLRKPAFDLTLRFRGDLSLRVFCDQTNLEDDDSNYTFHAKDRIYIVGSRGRIRFETPSGEVPRL
jgi:hypothetical protein